MPKKIKIEKTAPAVEGSGGIYFENDRGVATFSSGCQLLDLALGGGWARGRIINIVGDKSTGKTLLAIEATANFAKTCPDAQIYYNEVESAFDKSYAAALGMPLERVTFAPPCFTVEDLFKHLESVIEATPDEAEALYIVDSLDALSDDAEINREIDKGAFGASKAKKMSELFRRLNQKLANKQITVIFISQVRDNIGVMFGRKTTRSGGRALDFYASQVIYLAHLKILTQQWKGEKRATGVEIKAKVDKNKIGLPFREVTFTIQFGYGIDDLGASLDWLDSTKNLDQLTPMPVDKYLASLEELDDTAFKAEIERIHEVTARFWNEIEMHFAPTRKKYV